MSNSRERFESHMKEDCNWSDSDLARCPDSPNDYDNHDIQMMWCGWQAHHNRMLNQSEPALIVEVWNEGGSGRLVTAKGIENLPHGTKLYTLSETQ